MSEKTMQDLFDLLHRKQAETLLARLESGEATPAELSAINRFLSDNSVTGVKGENKALNKLSQGLAAYEAGEQSPIFGGTH